MYFRTSKLYHQPLAKIQRASVCDYAVLAELAQDFGSAAQSYNMAREMDKRESNLSKVDAVMYPRKRVRKKL